MALPLLARQQKHHSVRLEPPRPLEVLDLSLVILKPGSQLGEF